MKWNDLIIHEFAAWSPVKAVLSLRNPSKFNKIFEVSVARVLELPGNESDDYIFFNAVKAGADKTNQPLARGKSFRITMQSYEVKVFNAVPNP